MSKGKFALHLVLTSISLVIVLLSSILLQPHTVFANPGWALQTADSTTEPSFTSIALDSNGYPHIGPFCGSIGVAQEMVKGHH